MKQRLLLKILKTFSLQLFPKEKLILNFYRIIYLTIFPSLLDPSRYVSVFFFIFAKFLQGVVAPMQIPHFRRPFSPSVWFNFPVPHFRENKGWVPPDPPQ